MSWIQNFVSAARKYFLFVTLHCTAPQSCYQKLTLHRAAPQIIYLNRKFLDISFFKKVFIQTILTVVVIKVSPYILDFIAIGYWHNSYWHNLAISLEALKAHYSAWHPSKQP